MKDNSISKEEFVQLTEILHKRFEKQLIQRGNIQWEDVRKRLEAHPEKWYALNEMEETGGEPDVMGIDEQTGAYLFVDCSAESPAGRRSLCYDEAALAARKDAPPRGSAEGMAADMGIELLTEDQYRELQSKSAKGFDLKTSSWIQTTPEIRALGGALFCDRRYDHVFTYHNGAQSYYAARGFRGMLKV